MQQTTQKKQYPIITVIGKDKRGIVAQVSSFLWEKKINIEEIQQGIMKGSFFMVMSIDISEHSISIADFGKEFEALGQKIGVKINIYDQAIFTAMHKI
jgi:ACT domain-containing protein